MKIYQKYTDQTSIDFQNNTILQNKIIGEHDLLEQKNNLELQNNRLNGTFNDLHIPGVIIKKDKNDDYILIDFNKKAKLSDKLVSSYIGKKIKNIYPTIEKFGILKEFDNVLLNGKPIKHQGYYYDKKRKGYKNSYIYRIELIDGTYELVSLYDDVTYIKNLEKSKKIISKIKKYHFLLWFTLITLLISFSFYININNENYNKIYTKYYNKSDITIIGSTRNTSNARNKIIQGSILYENNKYEKALKTFNKIELTNIDFYLGITNMELGNYEKSINNFNKIIQHGNNIFINQSEWLLSLCYIKLNKKVDAILILSNIAKNTNHYKHNESLKLLEIL